MRLMGAGFLPGLHVGTVSMFEEAGFRQVSAPTPRRLVMRIEFSCLGTLIVT